MNVSRRFFIGGLSSALAFGPRRVFAAAPGSFAGGRPSLAFGLLSDVHVGLARGGKGLSANYGTESLVKAFEWFRDNGADAVVIAGDLAHCGLAGELKAIADAWFGVFPGDKAPDGRHVERIFVFGNHDWSSPDRARAVFPDKAERDRNLLAADPGKWWREIFHEDWTPFFERQVNGYPFIGAHWRRGGCNGKAEHFTDGLGDYYATLKGRIDPSKPFFHVQHPHPRGTVHGNAVWGQDDGTATEILSAYPNAVAFSGHSHTSLLDELSIWQGAFTSVGCATLRNVYVNTAGILPQLEGGCENERTPRGRNHAELDGLKAMPVAIRTDCRQGQFVRVYADRVVFSRREFVTGAALCDDLVMPLPAAESRPFEFAGRAAKAVAPEFADGAKLEIRRVKGPLRRRKSKKDVEDLWEIAIPPPMALKSVRTVAYEIVATAKDGASKVFGMVDANFRFPATDSRVSEPSVFRVACKRLPKEGIEFSVRAVSCWGRKSKPLKCMI